MPFDYDPRGREGIGVVQPHAGTDYPLLDPSADVRDLLADFYLSYGDPGDYGGIGFVAPFRIQWLSGFGTGPADSTPGAPTPVNAVDLLVVDAVGTVVFDSTLVIADLDHPNSAFASRGWGPRLQIYEWSSELMVCRVVVHTKWSPDEDPVPREYPSQFLPAAALLDPRSCHRLPKRVLSIGAVLSQLKRCGVEFVAGYNIKLTNARTQTKTLRAGAAITFDATPGGGLGIYPGCEPQPLYIRRINGIEPSPTGDFLLAAADCYYVRQPMHWLTGGESLSADAEVWPEVLLFPGNQLDAELPDPLAGQVKTAAGWPPADNPAYAHLKVGNDCRPCCDCDDYVAVAEYLNRVRDRYAVVGQSTAAVNQKYLENRDRWLAIRECVYRRPLRLQLQPQICPYLDVLAQYVNNTDQCQQALALTVTLATAPPDGLGTQVPGYGIIYGVAVLPGSFAPGTQRYTLDGEWPTFTAHWDGVQPGATVYVKFRLSFADCGVAGDTPENLAAYIVQATLTGTLADSPIQIQTADGVFVAATVSASSSLECPGDINSIQNLGQCLS